MTTEQTHAALFIAAVLIGCGILSAILPPLVGRLLRKIWGEQP